MTYTNDIEQIQRSQENIKAIVQQNRDSISALETLTYVFNSVTALLAALAALNSFIISSKKTINMMRSISKSDLDQTRIVENILHELRGIAVGSSRCCIGIFENGEATGAIHHHKMRITHEAIDSDTKAKKEDYQSVSLSKVQSEILNSSADNFVIFSKLDANLPRNCKDYMELSGTPYIISRLFKSKSLRNFEENYDGMLNIEYPEIPKTNPLEEAETLRQMEVVFEKLSRAVSLIKRGKKLKLDFK